MNSAWIRIGEIEQPTQNSLIYNIQLSKNIAKFFTGERLSIEYTIPVDQVPYSIQIIPLLAVICPVAWATGADIFLDEIDKAYYSALQEILRGFQTMHPKIQWQGNIIPQMVKTNVVSSGNTRSATLFSGGLDSVVTYIRRRTEKPCLVSVWGADVSLNQTSDWIKIRQAIAEFADDNGLQPLFVKSNFRRFIDETALDIYFGQKVGGWWGGVEHGLILIGLCAPLSHCLGIGKVYIPASYSIHSPGIAWGSTPEIDSLNRWADTSVYHDGYEIDRQEKIALFAEYIRTEGKNLILRVCWESQQNGGNCSVCEKCSRTIIGLLLEGLDPNNHGFTFGADTLSNIKAQLEAGRWATFSLWGDYIKRRIPDRIELLTPEYQDFFRWFWQFDTRSHVHKASFRLDRLINRAFRAMFPEAAVIWYKMLCKRIKPHRRKLRQIIYERWKSLSGQRDNSHV